MAQADGRDMAVALDVSTEAKTVLITGVSRGCGRAMAVELARRGHTVIGIARSEEKLESLRHECPRPDGQPHLFAAVDVTSDAGVEVLARRVLEDGLVPDIVVNNAAMSNKPKKIWDLSCEEVDMVLDTNIKGTINVLRHFLPIMVNKGHGVVVNISSIYGKYAHPYVAPYCTTKWAIEGLSRAVSMEVPRGVTIVALDPGVIQTDLLIAGFGEKAKQFPTPEVWAPTAVDMILNFKNEDNGASLAMAIDEKILSNRGALFPQNTAT